MHSEELRKYLDIINENSEEVLTEGMLQKLAGLALGTVLALGPKIGQADTVYTYFDPGANKMQTVLDMSKVPASAKTVMAVDTDTQQVMLVRSGSPTAKEIKPDPAAVKQAQFTKDTKSFSDEPEKSKSQQPQIYKNFSLGMSVDDVVRLSNGDKINKASGWGVVEALVDSGKVDPTTIKVKSDGTPWGAGDTFYQFKDGKLTGIHFAINIQKSSLKDIKDGEGLMGFPSSQLGIVFKKAFNQVSAITGSSEGNASLNTGGKFSTNIGIGKAMGDKAVGLGIPLDKVGNDVAVIDTSNGYVAMQIFKQQGMADRFRPGVLVVGLTTEQGKVDTFNFK